MSPPSNQFSLGNQSPQLRKTAAFNSIAVRDRTSTVGLDDAFEVLRSSGKELICEPYPYPNEIIEEAKNATDNTNENNMIASLSRYYQKSRS